MTAGAAVLALGAVVYAFVLDRLRLKDRAYPSTVPADSTWWFGYARDLGNLCGWLAFTAGFWLSDFPLPEAFVAGAGLTLASYGLDYFIGRTLKVRRAGFILAPLLVGVVALVAALRAPLVAGLHALRSLLF
ncbi:MAG TPA: hypothetical protein VKE22_26905 [Haliangiales bacterium]|nr:hypothetical protein [Haliangiales bacterium]